MQDFVQLNGNKVVNLCDARIDHRLGVFRHRHRAFQNLSNKVLYKVFAALFCCGVAGQSSILDDAVEETHGLGGGCRP